MAATCCSWPPSERRRAAVLAAVEGVDWARFRRIVARHRVDALVWHALKEAGCDVPGEIGRDLSNAASRTGRQNLRLTGESLRLKKHFDGAGIPILFLKGTTLGKLAYGTISLKMGWDIDVLVPGQRLGEATRLLEAIGYSMVIPSPGSATSAGRWHETEKESVWHEPATGSHVELHTRLADNLMLLGGVGMSSPRQQVELGAGTSLPTLATDYLFAYLCVHGSSSAWFRLKWIADVAALLSSSGPDEIERLYRRSIELGAGRSAAQALLLSAFLFGTDLSMPLRRELESDPVSLWLFKSALGALAGRTEAVEMHERRLATAPIHLTQFGLLPGLKFKVGELRRQITTMRHQS